MKAYAADSTIRIDYNPTSNKTAFVKQDIGPSVYVAIAVDPGTPTDANRIYVDSSAGNDSTGTGTSAAPYLTLLKSANSCTAAKQYVHVADDAAVFIEDLSAIDNEYFQGVYRTTGHTASMWRVSYGFTPADANSIFVTKAGNDSTGDGSLAAPVLTVAKAITLCDATHQAVVIVPAAAGEVYTEAPFEFTGNFLALYGWNTGGYTATIKFTQTAASVATTSSAYTFSTDQCSVSASCILTNGNIVFAYIDGGDSQHGKYMIKDTANQTVKAETQFNTGISQSTTGLSIAPLLDGGFVIAYLDGTVNGSFEAFNASGVQTKSETTFNAGQTSSISLCVLPISGYVVFSYKDTADSGHGKFRIYDPSDWSDIKTETTFSLNAVLSISVSSFSNDKFIIAFTHTTETEHGYFCIYDSTGTLDVAITEFHDNKTNYITTSIFSNDSVIIAYMDASDNNYGKFCIYSSTGTMEVSETVFNGDGNSIYISTDIFSNDLCIIAYNDASGGLNGKFCIYDSGGNVVVNETLFAAGAVFSISARIFSNNNFEISYSDSADGDKGKFLYYTFFGWSPVTVSAASTVTGLTFDGDDLDLMHRMFNGTAKLTAKYCEFTGVNNQMYPTNSWAIYTTSGVDMQNCIVHDNGCGVYTQENTAVFKNNLFYWNEKAAAVYIKGTAATASDIIVEHNTFFQNETAIELEDNGGTAGGSKEVVKNNIIFGNYSCGIYAETAMTYSYSINTDTNNNATEGSGCIGANPLFVNEGAYTATDIDLKIKLRNLGYSIDSPAYELADDTTPDRDAGAWDVIAIGSETTWTTWTFEKPGAGIKPRQEPVGATFTVRKDGSVSSTVEAWIEYLPIAFTGITLADYTSLMALLACGKSQVRVFGQPTTSPSEYDTFHVKYGSVNQSSTHYENTKTGYSDVNLEFARGYE